MARIPERRSSAKPVSSEAFNKKAIVVCVCSCAVLLTLTLCTCVILGRASPESIGNALLIPIVMGLMGLLGRTGSDPEKSGPPTPVTVTNAPSDPVPVEAAPDTPDPTTPTDAAANAPAQGES